MRGQIVRWLSWALVVIGAAGVTAAIVMRQSAHTEVPDLGKAAAPMRADVEQALAAEAKTLEPTAASAARIPELAAALGMGADRATLSDLIENEDWWAPFRSRFALSGVVRSKGSPALVGAAPSDVAQTDVVRSAREQGSASGVLNGGGRPLLAAAARVLGSRDPAGGAVVLLGSPLDQIALKEIADTAHVATAVSDGSKLIAASVPDLAGARLAAMVGREGRGPTLLGDGRLATAWPLAGGFWMLAAGPAPSVPAPGHAYIPLGIAGAVLLLLGLGLSRGAGGAPARATSPASAEATEAPTADVPVRVSARAEPEIRSNTDFYEPRGGGRPVSPGAVQQPQVPTAPGMGPTYAAGAIAAAQEQSAEGVQMGRYRLIERIGEGGMAEIFFAAAYGAEDFVRHFVVKRMHPHLARNREAVNQFIDEARLQAGLVHSNIVPVFDFGKAGAEYFLALEYIHGRDVGQIVQRHLEMFNQPLSLPIAFYIAHEVMEALAFAHSQIGKDGAPLDIVHRDVSPGNVLVSYRGEVKLTDFGIAKAERRVSRTEVGMVKGNASFMSPEQARGEVVDKRSDIFSAGVVLYYCLTAQSLYRGETTLNRLLRAAVGPATSQFGKIEQLPLPAARVLRRAVALEPGQRYADAAELAHELAPQMAGRGEMAQLMDRLFPVAQRRDLR
jgi:hypothetical protein